MPVELFTASLLLWVYVLFSRQVHDFGEVFSTAVLDRNDEYTQSRNNFTEVIISLDIFYLGAD